MPADANDDCCVYWVNDEFCIDPFVDGYVGITKHFKSRSRVHLERFRGAAVVVLFRGNRMECAAVEQRYRPRPNMGWNSSNGGGRWRKNNHNPSVVHPSVTQD